MALHGGVISAKNNHAGGTSFRVMLPMKEMPKEELVVAGGTSEKENLSVMEEVPLQKETLLVVDDNHDMRRYIRSLLQKEYKILLNVKIDLNNRECPTTAVEKDMLYKLIIKKFPLDDKTS